MRAAAITSGMLVLLLGGCQGDGGAVSVRWRIVDLSTGANFDPGGVKAAGGYCCFFQAKQGSICLPDNTWVIESVSINLADAVTGAPLATSLPSFPCSIREKTTDFVLTPGTFAISLGATNNIGVGLTTPMPVFLPPPSVRTIVRGDVVNLDVIEIGVNPLPLPH